MHDKKSRVLILGGGFAGVYAALEFERRKDPDIEITLVNRDNFFLFTPMLHEIAASDLDITNIVNPVRKMLRHVDFFAGDVESIDLEKRAVVVSHGFDHHTHTLEYDHLVLALGSITNFFKIPGLEERAFTMKSLSDAIQLRNRLIGHLEEADTECAAKDREGLLTFVVAGGGFAGVETIASINDFLRDVLPFYPNLKPEMLRVVLVHPGEYILSELGEKLGRYADEKLRHRGVEVRCKTRVSGVTQREVQLDDGTRLTSFTLVWTAGASPNPTVDLLDCPKKRGRLQVSEFLDVRTLPGVWAIGDIVKTQALAHVASHEGIVAVEDAAGQEPHPVDYDKVPSCTYCDPEVASVGLTEDEARKRGHDVVVGQFPFSAIAKAKILEDPRGFVKIVAEKKYDQVLGVHIIGAHATELISEATTALNLEATAASLFQAVHAHPTLAETMGEAALAVHGRAIHI